MHNLIILFKCWCIRRPPWLSPHKHLCWAAQEGIRRMELDGWLCLVSAPNNKVWALLCLRHTQCQVISFFGDEAPFKCSLLKILIFKCKLLKARYKIVHIVSLQLCCIEIFLNQNNKIVTEIYSLQDGIMGEIYVFCKRKTSTLKQSFFHFENYTLKHFISPCVSTYDIKKKCSSLFQLPMTQTCLLYWVGGLGWLECLDWLLNYS